MRRLAEERRQLDEERIEQLQTSNERLLYDMQRRGRSLDDDGDRSAIRRGLRAGPAQPNAESSEAGAPADSPPPSLPPGAPSSTSSGSIDDFDSLPDSFPTLRSTASSSTGLSEGEQQEAVQKVPPAPVFNLAASSCHKFWLHPATSSAPTKKRAPPGSAAAPRAKKVYSTPYTVFCQEQRPLLPRSLLNSQREWTLGQMWKSLPDEEKAMYKPEDGNVRMATRCSIGLIPSPAAGLTGTAARYPSTALPLDTHVVAGAPLAVLPAAPSAAAPPQLQLTQTLQRMAEDDVLDLLL